MPLFLLFHLSMLEETWVCVPACSLKVKSKRVVFLVRECLQGNQQGLWVGGHLVWMAVLMDMWWSPAVTGFFFFYLAPKSSALEIYLRLAEVYIKIVFSWECCAKHSGRKAAAGMLHKAGNRKYQPESILFDWQGKRVHPFHKSEFGQK